MPSPHLTEVFITYSETDLYVGFIAYADMANLCSSVRNRDEGYRDDNVLIGIDTYGDGRYMVSLGANPEGNQLDLKLLSTGQDDVSQITANNTFAIFFQERRPYFNEGNDIIETRLNTV